MENKLNGVRYDTEIGFPEIDRILQGTLLKRKNYAIDPNLARLPRNLLLQRQGDIPLEFKKRRTNLDKSIPKEDLISHLPVEILEFIISLLPMREGAATSILSKRWRYLWTTSVSCFDFDLTNRIVYTHLMLDRIHTNSLKRQENDKRYLRRKYYDFTRWVDQVLLHCESCGAFEIKALRIAFLFLVDSTYHINRWIAYAASRGLVELDLQFELAYTVCSPENAFRFPFTPSLASLEKLRLTGCYFSSPPNFKGFNSLTSLTLKDNYVTKDSFQSILANCPFLECFTLLHCQFVGFHSTVDFSGPSLRLKHLFFSSFNTSKVEVHDTNLISLELIGFDTKFSIKNTPHLARLVICTGTPVDILSDLPRLETLFVTTISWKLGSILPQLCVFKDLKRLVVPLYSIDTDLLEVIRLLEACPLLQKLELDMGFDGMLTLSMTADVTDKIIARHGNCHNNLKEIEIYGFQDLPHKIELIKYLLRNAIVLEKMEIFLFCKKYRGDGEWVLCQQTDKETQMSLDKVRNLLEKEARPLTKLMLYSHV